MSHCVMHSLRTQSAIAKAPSSKVTGDSEGEWEDLSLERLDPAVWEMNPNHIPSQYKGLVHTLRCERAGNLALTPQ